MSFWGREERRKGYVWQGGLISRNLKELCEFSVMNENLILGIFKSDKTLDESVGFNNTFTKIRIYLRSQNRILRPISHSAEKMVEYYLHINCILYSRYAFQHGSFGDPQMVGIFLYKAL